MENEKINDFGKVLEHIKALPNFQIAYRKGWNGKRMYITLQVPTDLSKMTLPYIYMKTMQGDLVPWLASQTDLLEEDWCLDVLSNFESIAANPNCTGDLNKDSNL